MTAPYVFADRFFVRAPTTADLAACVTLMNECYGALGEKPEFELDETAHEWQSPGFELARDARVVLTESGDLVGYEEVWDTSEPHVQATCWGCVHPDYCKQGLGTELLHFARQRAQLTLARAPQGARVIMSSWLLAQDEAGHELMVSNGFSLIRYFWRMVAELDQPPAAPWVPAGLTIRPMRAGEEERAVVETIRDAFRDHWGYLERPFEADFAQWQHWMAEPGYDPSLWFVAVDRAEIAGTVLCRLHYPGDPEMAWIDDLAVRRQWRNRGLGLALLQHAFVVLYERGQRRAGLGVDAASLTGATRLYEKAGMRKVRQMDIFEKELRPGKEIAVRSL